MSGNRRIALGLALVGGLAMLALLIGSRLAADVMLRGDPAAALEWDVNDQRALEAFADRLFEGTPSNDDLASAESSARRAFIGSPLRSGAVRVLGQVAERRGDEARARALIATAAERWLYDLDAQIWMINAYLRSGDVSAALRHVDETLRARPRIWDEVLPSLVPLAVSQEGLEPLSKLLATSPSWRLRFLEVLCANAAPMEPLRLFTALADKSSPPTDPELKAFLERLVKEGQLREAYLVWVKFLPKERMAALGNVHNGGFSFPISGLPFDWAFGNLTGSKINVIGRPDEIADLALRVEFNGNRAPFRHVAQMLLLSPGRYELTVAGRVEALENERGLWWKVTCADGRLLGETDRILGTTGWKALRTEFVVPEESCVAQRLQLELASRIPIEEEVSGEAWFDDIAVSPLSSASGS